MKTLFFASVLTLVGSCATKRYTEKIQDIKDSIVFEDTNQIKTYANTITAEELSKIVYTFSSDENQGRKTGEFGHHIASQFLKDYYIKEGIASPFGTDNYYQSIPESFFSNNIKSSQNVMAFIKGSQFPEQILIISAHSDHLGITNNEVNNGADDNGSGTAALMEMAQAFHSASQNGYRPKRSILFLHLTGEEEGLYGSRYYIEHPVFTLDSTIANLNIDMVGRVDRLHKDNPNYIYIIGADRLSTELHYISEAANEKFAHLELDYTYNAENEPNQYYSRSDHYNFARNGIPVIFYFNGEHEDYHQSTDTADKINYPLLEKRTKLIFSTAWYLANSSKRITVDKS